MENRSWFFQNGFYYTLLAVFILLHLILLAIRLSRDSRLTEISHPPLKIRYISDILKNKSKQIVESHDPKFFLKKVKPDFLSDKNRTFLQQTKAKQNESLSLSDLGAFSRNHHPLKNGFKVKKLAGTDYLKDIKEGHETNLNTAEFKFFGYFQRIKKQVEIYWTRELLLLVKRQRVSSRELKTYLVVILDHAGRVASIDIYGPSGILELDKVAIEAFKLAGSFPNPPRELIKNGQVKLQWGFIVNPDD
jgi:hypothetical protein